MLEPETRVEAHVIYTETPYDLRVWGKVKQFMIDHKIDIVTAHGTRANSNVFAAKKLDYHNLYGSWLVISSESKPMVKMLKIKSESFLTKRPMLLLLFHIVIKRMVLIYLG
jgi:hypothetical protein